MSSPIEVILQVGSAVTAAELGKLDGVRSRSQAIEAALSGQGTSTDPDYSKTPEQFQTMSHQAIYDAVHGTTGMDVAGLQTLGTVWKKASTELTTAAQANVTDLARLLGNGEWSGSSGDAARAASQRMAKVIDVIGQVFGAVGTRVEGLACAAEAVRAAVQPPIAPVTRLNPDDPRSSIIPGLVNPTTATNQRTEQDQVLAATRAAMEQIYTPSYPPNGSGVPSYPLVSDALAGSDQSASGGNSGAPGSGSPSPTSPGSSGQPTQSPGSDDDSTSDDPSNTEGAQPDSTNPSTAEEGTTEQTADSSGSPSESSPAQTAAASAQSSPLGTAGSPTSGLPSSGSPSSGLPGAGLPGGGTASAPNLGAPVPGVSAQSPSGSVGAGSAAAGGARAGAHGPMGPMAPGAGQRRGGSDDDEHQSPDYLRRVHEDWTEGIDSRPAVVGADAPSAMPVEPSSTQTVASAPPVNHAAPVHNSPAPETPATSPDTESLAAESVPASTEPATVEGAVPTPAADPPTEQSTAGLSPEVANLLSSYGWGTPTPPPPAAPTERERP
ncbi:hypothetical protein ACFWU5_01900 [Nocardia sp. NPDC058640]|uniref:hypothetical protein n=1 Tax=Nocardia sp. NPDC058640 TaxID=3346571 RepID=UPI00364707C3